MVYVIIIFAVVLLIALLTVFLTAGRIKHPKLEEFFGLFVAHRGLHSEGIPENSLPAFERAVVNGYGIELDVHLSCDGVAVVHHDSNLKRMTGEEGIISEMTADEICGRRLLGTEYRVPKFTEVLSVVAGKVPLVVELKCEYGKNVEELCVTSMEILDSYRKEYGGSYCIESFNPFIVRWLKKNRPDVFRGQLSERFFANRKNASFVDFIMETLWVNVLGRPDFVAYNQKHKNGSAIRLWSKIYGAPTAFWTVRSQKELDGIIKDGYKNFCCIFEGFIPEGKIPVGKHCTDAENESESENVKRRDDK